LETGGEQEGEYFITKGINAAIFNGFLTWARDGYLSLAKFYNRKNYYKEALYYQSHYIRLVDSLESIQRTEQIKLGEFYLSALRESYQNELLRKEKILQNRIVSYQQTSLVIGAVAMTVLLLMLYYLKRINIKRKEINKILIAQKEEISLQKNELLKLSNTKDKFFSIIAHDLRSPLNSLKSFTSLVGQHASLISKEEMIEAAKQLDDTLENTLKLTDNLLTWARQQMQMDEQVPISIPLKEIIEEIIGVYQDSAAGKKIELTHDTAENLVVHADRNQLLFILRNLINNAIKFTPESGRVMIRSRQHNNSIAIEVIDTGVGMAPEKMDRLFEIGRNTKTYGTAGEKGTGLGLILCEEFVTKNNGQLTVKSKVGEGSTFAVHLPSGKP
jgi:signal transduction histidine kinase